MSDVVERLREGIIADAFESNQIASSRLADRLIRERHEAADEIERLRRIIEPFKAATNAGALYANGEAALLVNFKHEQDAAVAEESIWRVTEWGAEIIGCFDASVPTSQHSTNEPAE